MAKPKVAILGGRGMLGSDAAALCRQRGFTTVVLDLPNFDIRNKSHLSTIFGQADVVVNCAAYTNVEKAESQTKLAYQVNAEAVRKLGSMAKEAGVWVLHISTDFVFDGKSDKPYSEDDKMKPVNAYGETKLKGEQFLSESGCKHCILRIEWTYGLHGDNFVRKLIRRAKTEKNLKIVDDQIGSPTATTEVAKVICTFLEKRPEGLFHFAADGFVSRFQMAKFIIEKLNIPVQISPCKSEDFPAAAVRPLNSRFDCSKIKKLLGLSIEPWQLPLERFLSEL
ncbi:dTDP-4-dehydrorhamnose reductase [Planctomycetota bacterium]